LQFVLGDQPGKLDMGGMILLMLDNRIGYRRLLRRIAVFD